MVEKPVKIGLVWGIGQYEVKTITNSTLYKPGQWLSIEQVEALCKTPNWDITIADDETFQHIIGMVINAVPIPKL